MVAAVITFPDAQLAVRDLLRALLAARPEGKGVTVSTKPIPGADGTHPLPYVQVVSDGAFRDSQLNGRASVRVLAYGRDEGASVTLAALCEGLLLAEASSDKVRGCSPLAGPQSTSDPDNDLPFSYFTLTARLRPRQL